MKALRKSVLLLVSLLIVAASADAQEYKEEYNSGMAAANAKDYPTARAHFATAAQGAAAADDAEVERQASYVAAQLDNRMGNAALRAENFDDALKHFQNGVAIFPSYIKNHYGQGLALKKLGRVDEALTTWQGILDNTQDRQTVNAAEKAIRDHFNYQASSAVGKSNPSATDGDRALAALEQSLQYVDPDADYYYYVAVAQYAKGNNEAAITAADQALALHRGSRVDAAKIHYVKGEAQVRIGDVAGARTSFTNASFGSYRASAEHYLESL